MAEEGRQPVSYSLVSRLRKLARLGKEKDGERRPHFCEEDPDPSVVWFCISLWVLPPSLWLLGWASVTWGNSTSILGFTTVYILLAISGVSTLTEPTLPGLVPVWM